MLVGGVGLGFILFGFGWLRRTLRLVGMNFVTSAVMFLSCGCADMTALVDLL